MRETKCQGTAGYVTRMSGGVGGRGREASSYPDFYRIYLIALLSLVMVSSDTFLLQMM